jgi:diguanylate cyclase (GGDEF)-like protein
MRFKASRKADGSHPILWLGARRLPRGVVEQELTSLGLAVRCEPVSPRMVERVYRMEPELVLVDVSVNGSDRRIRKLLADLESAKQTLVFPVFLVLEAGQPPPAVPADGCLLKERGLGRNIKSLLEAAPGWRALRSERRRLLLELKSLKRQNRRLRTLVVRDDLTQLYNLRFFTENLGTEHARATRFGRQYSLLFIDLDDLREINNRFGHLAGSHTLQRVGDYLRKNVRHIDVAARLGGDEFVVLCPETGKAAARVLAERIRQDLETLSVQERGRSFPISASLGLAAFPDDGDLPQQILERADRALYVAKAAGRNRVCSWGDFVVGRRSERGSLHGIRAAKRTVGSASRQSTQEVRGRRRKRG